MERLQKIIAKSGYCSRRKAEKYIQEGKVKVNDNIITELGTKVDESAKITINDEIINQKKEKEYYLLYKPAKIISSAKDDKQRKTVVDLINTKERIYPVGRLDYDTTGLILLTNDGELTNILSHPNNKIEKIYRVKVKGIITPKELMNIKKGIEIEGRKVKTTYVKIKQTTEKTTTILIGIIEGRNHIIKKMFAKLDHDVIKIKRETYAFLNLEGLKIGEYRPLTIKEIKKLYALK